MVRKNDIDNFVKKKKQMLMIQKNKNIAATAQDLIHVPNFFLQIEVITFIADMRWSVHIDDKNKNILVLEEWPTQGLQ